MSFLYDRQLNLEIFKRFQATHWTLHPQRASPTLGPTFYNPKTVDEIYREKICSRFGRFFQRSERFAFPSKTRCEVRVERRKPIEQSPKKIKSTWDRRTNEICEKRRAPPVGFYEQKDFLDEFLRKRTGKNSQRTRIYGPFVRFGTARSNRLPDWFKGPARLDINAPASIVDVLFSRSNRQKGKFRPIPKKILRRDENKSDRIRPRDEEKKSPRRHSVGFLSSSERFPSKVLPFVGPTSYDPQTCSHRCSKKNKLII